MYTKLTWLDIFQDFKQRYPRLGADAKSYEPNEVAQIRIHCNDGSSLIYNYFGHTLYFEKGAKL